MSRKRISDNDPGMKIERHRLFCKDCPKYASGLCWTGRHLYRRAYGLADLIKTYEHNGVPVPRKWREELKQEAAQ